MTTDPDYTIYRQERLPYIAKGRRGHCFFDRDTRETVNHSVQETIRDFEDGIASRGDSLAGIHILDGPYRVGGIYLPRSLPNIPLLYVHCHLASHVDSVGSGFVMVVGKESGEVFYCGTDNME